MKLTGTHELISYAEPINGYRRKGIKSTIFTIPKRWFFHDILSVLPFCMSDKIITEIKLETHLLPRKMKALSCQCLNMVIDKSVQSTPAFFTKHLEESMRLTDPQPIIKRFLYCTPRFFILKQRSQNPTHFFRFLPPTFVCWFQWASEHPTRLKIG